MCSECSKLLCLVTLERYFNILNRLSESMLSWKNACMGTGTLCKQTLPRGSGGFIWSLLKCVFDMSVSLTCIGQLWSLDVAGSCRKYYQNFSYMLLSAHGI